MLKNEEPNFDEGWFDHDWWDDDEEDKKSSSGILIIYKGR